MIILTLLNIRVIAIVVNSTQVSAHGNMDVAVVSPVATPAKEE